MQRVWVAFTVGELARLAYEVALQQRLVSMPWRELPVRTQRDWLACIGLVLEQHYPARTPPLPQA